MGGDQLASSHGMPVLVLALLVISVLLLLMASEDGCAEGPSQVNLYTPRDDYWFNTNNVTFKWSLSPMPSHFDFHLMLWYPNGTVGADVTGSNGTSYDHGFLPDMGGYNCSLTINYTAEGRNWTARTNRSTFGVDTVPPENPTHAVMGNGTSTSGVWQSNETDVVIFVYGAHDDLSGVDAYVAYWGPDPGGKPTIITTGNRFFLGTTPECIWYFRVQAVDRAWNRAETITLYVHMHDALPPLVPDVVEQLNGSTESDVWQNEVDSPRFRWEEPWDQTSGVKGYRVYFGPDPNGTSETFLTNRTWEPGAVTDGTHYMRISPVDVAGNAAPWSTRYLFRFDSTPPGVVTLSCEQGNLSSTGEATFTWTVPEDLSGIGRFRYRLNDGAGTWVTLPTTTFETMRDRHHVFGVAAEDTAGNLGEWSFVNLTVDTTPPSGSVAFDVEGFATNVTVPLVIVAHEDTSGVEAMRFSPDGIVWGEWMPFRSTHDLTLPAGDGNKSVQLLLRDVAGHVSVDRMVDWVLLDTTPPPGELSVNGGAANATSPTVTLNVTAEDANGISAMRIAEDEGAWGDEMGPFHELEHTLSPGDGWRTVRVMIIDGAGLFTVVSASLLLDTEPPTGTVLINGGDEYADSPTLEVRVLAEDATSGVVAVRLSEDGVTWGPWENHTGEAFEFNLSAGDGQRTVHVQLRDGASLVSVVAINDTVMLDTIGPSGSVVIEGGDPRAWFQVVQVTFKAEDTSGVTDMRFSWDGEEWSEWEPYRTSKELTMTGEYGTNSLYVEYRDASGRVSPPVTDSIEYVGVLSSPVGYLVLALVLVVFAALVVYMWRYRR